MAWQPGSSEEKLDSSINSATGSETQADDEISEQQAGDLKETGKNKQESPETASDLKETGKSKQESPETASDLKETGKSKQESPETASNLKETGNSKQESPETASNSKETGNSKQESPETASDLKETGKSKQESPETASDLKETGKSKQESPETASNLKETGNSKQESPKTASDLKETGNSKQESPETASGKHAVPLTNDDQQETCSGNSAHVSVTISQEKAPVHDEESDDELIDVGTETFYSPHDYPDNEPLQISEETRNTKPRRRKKKHPKFVVSFFKIMNRRRSKKRKKTTTPAQMEKAQLNPDASDMNATPKNGSDSSLSGKESEPSTDETSARLNSASSAISDAAAKETFSEASEVVTLDSEMKAKCSAGNDVSPLEGNSKRLGDEKTGRNKISVVTVPSRMVTRSQTRKRVSLSEKTVQSCNTEACFHVSDVSSTTSTLTGTKSCAQGAAELKIRFHLVSPASKTTARRKGNKAVSGLKKSLIPSSVTSEYNKNVVAVNPTSNGNTQQRFGKDLPQVNHSSKSFVNNISGDAECVVWFDPPAEPKATRKARKGVSLLGENFQPFAKNSTSENMISEVISSTELNAMHKGRTDVTVMGKTMKIFTVRASGQKENCSWTAPISEMRAIRRRKKKSGPLLEQNVTSCSSDNICQKKSTLLSGVGFRKDVSLRGANLKPFTIRTLSQIKNALMKTSGATSTSFPNDYLRQRGNIRLLSASELKAICNARKAASLLGKNFIPVSSGNSAENVSTETSKLGKGVLGLLLGKGFKPFSIKKSCQAKSQKVSNTSRPMEGSRLLTSASKLEFRKGVSLLGKDFQPATLQTSDESKLASSSTSSSTKPCAVDTVSSPDQGKDLSKAVSAVTPPMSTNCVSSLDSTESTKPRAPVSPATLEQEATRLITEMIEKASPSTIEPILNLPTTHFSLMSTEESHPKDQNSGTVLSVSQTSSSHDSPASLTQLSEQIPSFSSLQDQVGLTGLSQQATDGVPADISLRLPVSNNRAVVPHSQVLSKYVAIAPKPSPTSIVALRGTQAILVTGPSPLNASNSTIMITSQAPIVPGPACNQTCGEQVGSPAALCVGNGSIPVLVNPHSSIQTSSSTSKLRPLLPKPPYVYVTSLLPVAEAEKSTASEISQKVVTGKSASEPDSGRSTVTPDEDNQREEENLEHSQCCIDCGMVFDSQDALRVHASRKDMLIHLNCRSCKKILDFHNSCDFEKHVKQHRQNVNWTFSSRQHGTSAVEEPSDVKCSECAAVLHDALGLGEHFHRSSTRLDPTFLCRLCKQYLANACAFSAHKRMHMQKSPWICPHCGVETIAGFLDLLIHMAETCCHFSSQCSFRCKVNDCNVTAPSEEDLIKHLHTAHLRASFKCDHCQVEVRDLQSHFRQKHKDKTEFSYTICYSCELCSFSSISRESYELHMLAHLKEMDVSLKRRLRCLYCWSLGKTYRISMNAQASLPMHHRLLHNRDIQICGICFEQFRTISLLLHHQVERHSGPTAEPFFCFPCEECRMFFAFPSLRKCHPCNEIFAVDLDELMNDASFDETADDCAEDVTTALQANSARSDDGPEPKKQKLDEDSVNLSSESPNVAAAAAASDKVDAGKEVSGEKKKPTKRRKRRRLVGLGKPKKKKVVRQEEDTDEYIDVENIDEEDVNTLM